jgi:Flp pilus assembly protein TadD
VFAKNVEVYPQSGNVHDSLAEALLSKGDTASAVVQYRKVLELDPNNASARKKSEALAR